jgi:hypothetical protein
MVRPRCCPEYRIAPPRSESPSVRWRRGPPKHQNDWGIRLSDFWVSCSIFSECIFDCDFFALWVQGESRDWVGGASTGFAVVIWSIRSASEIALENLSPSHLQFVPQNLSHNSFRIASTSEDREGERSIPLTLTSPACK